MPRVTQSKPLITTARVEAYAASALRLLCWLFGVLLRLGSSGRSARLKDLLSHAEGAVECILFLKAVALYGPPPQRRPHPRSAPPGFRRRTKNSRRFFKSAKIRARKAGPIARVIALLDALAHPEAAVGYFFKQICKGLRLSRLVAVAPPTLELASALLPPSAAFCDTS